MWSRADALARGKVITYMAGRARTLKGPAPLFGPARFWLLWENPKTFVLGCSLGSEKRGADHGPSSPQFQHLRGSFADYQHCLGHFISAWIVVSTIMVAGHSVTRF